MDLYLKDSLCTIVGGASGIGLAAARLFLEEGAKVALWDIHPSLGEVHHQLVSEFGTGRLIAVPCDITQQQQVETAAKETNKALGDIDHLSHTAAIGSGKFGFPYTNLTPNDWTRVLEVNIMGMVHVAHVVGPILRERRKGTMTFLASVAGQIGSQTDPPYSASKAANINFAQCLAKDLAPHGVRVNIINPGMVQTPLNRSVWKAWNDIQPDELKRDYDVWAGEKVKAIVPLGKWQTTQDIANMLAFLASDRACGVTGQTINVDGGYVMHW